MTSDILTIPSTAQLRQPWIIIPHSISMSLSRFHISTVPLIAQLRLLPFFRPFPPTRDFPSLFMLVAKSHRRKYSWKRSSVLQISHHCLNTRQSSDGALKISIMQTLRRQWASSKQTGQTNGTPHLMTGLVVRSDHCAGGRRLNFWIGGGFALIASVDCISRMAPLGTRSSFRCNFVDWITRFWLFFFRLRDMRYVNFRCIEFRVFIIIFFFWVKTKFVN